MRRPPDSGEADWSTSVRTTSAAVWVSVSTRPTSFSKRTPRAVPEHRSRDTAPGADALVEDVEHPHRQPAQALLIATHGEADCDERPDQHLDGEVDVEVRAQLAALDAAAQDGADHGAPGAQQRLVERLLQLGVVAGLDDQPREDPERLRGQPSDRRGARHLDVA